METKRRKRRKNYNDPGHAHELTFFCYRGLKLLESRRTCNWLAESISESQKKFDFELWAYVFMPEHVHLIVRPRRAIYDVAEIRKSIKAPVGFRAISFLKENASEWLPKITRKRGEREERLFWQSGGGYDRNITEPTTLLKMIEYLHLNPVRRGLIEKADDWMWSSAAWYECGQKTPLRIDPIPTEWLADEEA